MNHGQEALNEVVGFFERRTGSQDGSQILLLDLIERLGIAHKEPDSRVRRIFLDAFDVDWGLNLCLLERSKRAIHTPLRAGVALRFDVAIERNPLLLSLFPAFEHKRGKGIKGTRFF